jgi:hypothetical protein
LSPELGPGLGYKHQVLLESVPIHNFPLILTSPKISVLLLILTNLLDSVVEKSSVLESPDTFHLPTANLSKRSLVE